MTRIGVVLVLAAAVAGCVSAPDMRIYTLDMRPSGIGQPPVKLVIDGLRPAEPLQRKEILIQTSPTELDYYATDQWAASLGELVTKKLDAELATDAARTLAMTGEILDFGQVDSSGGADALARLKLEFREIGASRYDTPLFAKTYEAVVATPSATPGAMAEALSRGLEQIAAAIAQDLAGDWAKSRE